MVTQFFSKFFILINILSSLAVANSEKPLITITQIAPHPSLDAIRQGILDELKEQKQDVEVVFDNAQGNIALAAQIAQKQVSLNPKVMVSITTPSTQAVYNAALKHAIPVIFSGVSDPQTAKLVDAAHTQKGKGITGVSDFAPLEDQLDLILKIQPNLKKLGVLYNVGETNSVALIAKFETLAKEKGIELVKRTAINTQELATVTASLIGKVEAIYIPNDNTVISSLESVLKIVNDKIPLYASDPESVEKGCLAAVAFGQYEIGRETGKLLVEFLKGTAIEAIPIKPMKRASTLLNFEVAKRLGVEFPKEVLQKNKESNEVKQASKAG